MRSRTGLPGYRIIDLSTPARARISLEKDLPVYMGRTCRAYSCDIKSHTGSYFETAAHLFREKPPTDRIPARDLIFRCLVAGVKPSGRLITEEALRKSCRSIRAHDALLVKTGWSKGKGKHPYFSRDAGKWLARSGIKLLGADIPRYDSGFKDPEGLFVDIFKKDISIVAGLGNMGKLPPGTCTLLVMPLMVKGSCTVPARVLALIRRCKTS